MDKNVKVIYNKLENVQLNEQGSVDLNESVIKGKQDLVNICNIFRDPRYETFRIFYMKDNKIVGQEYLTSKIPNAVVVFQGKKSEHIRIFEKMRNRMQRLGADGYYLAHNHPTESAKPSEKDMVITQTFDRNVKGFLGHIVLGSTDRYSIIEKDEKGLIRPKEKRIKIEIINTMQEQLEENTLYDIKISSRDELVALLKEIQNSKEYSIAILTDTKNNIRMVLDIPNKMFNQNFENFNGFFKNIARNCGATKVFVGTNNPRTYFKAIEHHKYGTFMDMVYLDNLNNNKAITENIKERPDLFYKETLKKSRKNRDAR